MSNLTTDSFIKLTRPLLIAPLLGLSVPTAVLAAPELNGYEMVFNDEFNGASLDTDKWATAPLWGPFQRTNLEEQYYLDKAGLDAEHPVDPFLFNGETLTIRATPVGAETVPAQPAAEASVWANYPEYTFNENYTPANRTHFSGLISSVNSFTFTHGYAEARVQVPAGQGLWPAFWQLTHKYVEDAPEIDIMESLGQFPNEVNHTMHYFDTSNNWALVSTPTYKTTGADFTADFHVYGMQWSPESVAWFVDGVEVERIDHSEFTIPKQAMYILANLAVGGTWPGSPNETTNFPADLQIDYIRVYQRKAPEVINAATLAADYQLMFSDEFTGSSLDSNKWNTSFLWGPYQRINQEEQVYIDTLDSHSNQSIDPFEVSDGTLKITAAEVLPADLPEQPAAEDEYWAAHPARQPNADYNNTWVPGYTSGIITSYDSFKFVHGYVEYRAKLPAGDGLWPAFWLLNGYYVGAQPEIDIMEVQGEIPNVNHQSYHYTDPNGNPVSSATTYQLPTGDFSQGFHTFGVKWHPGQIIWYVDGVAVRTLEGPEVSLQLMYLLANLAVGGNFVGPVDTDFPATLEIDYIRAYQLRKSPITAPPPPPPPPSDEFTPISPLTSTTTASPRFEWGVIGPADMYELLVYDRNLEAVAHRKFYNSDVICDGGNCSVLPTDLVLNSSTRHFWRVRYRQSGSWSALSSPVFFDYVPALPEAVTAITPIDSVDTASPTYQWQDLGNVDTYELLVYDRNLESIAHRKFYVAADICSEGVCSVMPDGMSLNFSTRHFWRVRSRNVFGWSALSDPFFFNYLSPPPEAVTPIEPIASVTTSSPNFQWELLANVDTYELLVYDRNLQAVVHRQFYGADEICTANSCGVSPAGLTLKSSTRHFWRVRARSSGGWSELSEPFYFDYLMDTPAQSITAVSPLNVASSASPTFQWIELDDTDAYELLVFDRFTETVAHRKFYNSDAICTAGTCSVRPTDVDLNFSTRHFWRVRARTACVWSALSSPFYFDYLSAPPGPVTPIAPLALIDTPSPSFQWEDLGNVDSYELLVYDRAIEAVIYRQFHGANSICTAGSCKLSPAGISVNFSTRHFWRVRSQNSGGWSALSEPFFFDYVEATP